MAEFVCECDYSDQLHMWCPVCGTPLKVVFGEPWNIVEGAEIDADR